jgi:hypothetical protein
MGKNDIHSEDIPRCKGYRYSPVDQMWFWERHHGDTPQFFQFDELNKLTLSDERSDIAIGIRPHRDPWSADNFVVRLNK